MNFIDRIKKAIASGEERRFVNLIEEAYKELKAKNIFAYMVKPKDLSTTDVIVALPDKEKVNFILHLAAEIHAYNKGRTTYSGADREYEIEYIRHAFLGHLFKIKVVLDEWDVEKIFLAFNSLRRGDWANITGWPLGGFVTQIERSFKVIPQSVKQHLIALKEEIIKTKQTDKETLKLLERIDSILFESDHGKESIKPVTFLGQDAFATMANETIARQPTDEKTTWYKLIAQAQKASGSKPSAKYAETCKSLVKELGADKFKRVVQEWFEFVSKLKETTQVHTYTSGGREYQHSTHEFLAAPNVEALKGFVWMCAQFHDTKTLHTLAALAERCFKKIPGKGPAAPAVGNACLYTLYKSKGLEGIAHLSRLKLRIKQSSTQALIEKYLQEAASAEGISVMEIEDLAVDDYELIDGNRIYDLDDYKAVLSIESIGSVNIAWRNADDKEQKTVPSFVKEKHAARLKKIKDTAKQIEIALSAQRDRLDRMLRAERKMTWAYFDKHYFSHGLMSFLSRNLIWKFESPSRPDSYRDRDTFTGIFLNGKWVTQTSEIFTPGEASEVSLWHPATAGLEEIRSWREFLMTQRILQPMKQAYREVYLLTDAEINTRTYSNRMAAHVLKQHQFNSLAKARGWKYSLLGNYDDGRYNEGALLSFPERNIRAEFWVNEVSADDAFNDTGIWNYVSTDQVRFVAIDTNEPTELVAIPPVLFSEVMRDVDLFVGVASVGNDPTWSDNGGIPAYRDYWQSYSFGDLTEIAKTRKEILQNLVPRLKIGAVATIKDRFLVVRGKKRTYKIHIGSTNILMEPNDQYLCIVPDRSKKENTGDVFLPFEGDTGLSVILSKAILLADDDKITDPTIISQINRN